MRQAILDYTVKSDECPTTSTERRYSYSGSGFGSCDIADKARRRESHEHLAKKNAAEAEARKAMPRKIRLEKPAF
jgi:hypothetical protein